MSVSPKVDHEGFAKTNSFTSFHTQENVYLGIFN
jgi:hypothetical protein